jgi:hypothetical protein
MGENFEDRPLVTGWASPRLGIGESVSGFEEAPPRARELSANLGGVRHGYSLR